jgi:hypothetical protein
MRFRRGIAAGTLLLATGAGLAGCGILPGGDGDLADDWGALGAPKGFVPERSCHAKEATGPATATEFAAVDCATQHEAETLYVGEFTGAAASASSPPSIEAAVAADAFDTCETEVNKVLGYDWRDMRLELKLITPSAQAWKGGARWFACDVVELADLENAETMRRTAGIQDALPTLPLGCFKATESGDDLTMAEVACTTSHNSEYVGSFTPAAKVGYPTSEAGWDVLHEGCDKVVADYLGISVTESNKRYSEIAWATSKKYWKGGNNNVRCFLWLGKTKMTGSAKDKKTSVPRWS